jgi:hypothetical protein
MPLADLSNLETALFQGECNMKRSRRVNWLIGFGLLAVILVPLYWILWFASPETIQTFAPGSPEYPAYVTFEQAFVLADSWLALAALIGVIGLSRMREWGILFTLLAGGSAIFLGLMDLLYDLQHAVFVPLTPEAAIEFAIVVMLLGLGTCVIILSWGARNDFDDEFN